MKKKLLSENAAYLYENLIEGIKVLEKQIEKLKIENNTYQKIERKLEVSNKRNIRYEKILNITPGTIENKLELLEFFTETVIPFISEKINSSYTSKIIEFMNNNFIEDIEEREEIEEVTTQSNSKIYYVYSHTMAGDKYPFYVGYSANNDNNYKRSKDFSGRNYSWYEYVINNGGIKNIKVKIIAEIDNDKAALDLEKYYIKHYADTVVNINHV